VGNFKIILVGFKPLGAVPTAFTYQAMLTALRKQFHVKGLACVPDVSSFDIIIVDNISIVKPT
jgi:hypothetical protein